MRPLYTATAVRHAERPLIDSGHGAELMRHAAWGLRTHVLKLLRAHGRVTGAKVCALVGKGNNGADALWALSFLAARGVQISAVTVFTTTEHTHTEARTAFHRAGGRLTTLHDVDTKNDAESGANTTWAGEHLHAADVVIDAVLGTGFSGVADVPGELDRHGVSLRPDTLVVACDIPSGVDGDTGSCPGRALPAHLTVTFGAMKTGLVVGPGAELAGQVVVIDIGLGQQLSQQRAFHQVEVDDVHQVITPPAAQAHKYSRGVVAVAAGSAQYPGAAVLVCHAALATGTGMVRMVGEPALRHTVVSATPEVVATPEVAGRAHAWVVGPGVGTSPAAETLLAQVLHEALAAGTPVVVDASGLEMLSIEHLTGFARTGQPLVLTPHGGELTALLKRLLPQVPGLDPEQIEHLVEHVNTNPLLAARQAARLLRAVVVFKGPTTVIATPQGECWIQPEGGPELATAGSGDTLAGIIGAVLSRTPGQPPQHQPQQHQQRQQHAGPATLGLRVACAVWVHSAAGRYAVHTGPFGASQLAPAVRAVLGQLNSPVGRQRLHQLVQQ